MIKCTKTSSTTQPSQLPKHWIKPKGTNCRIMQGEQSEFWKW